MARADILQDTIDALVQPGKGILAADESTGTITRRFKAIDLDSTGESRRAYRSLLLTTTGLGEYISGVILFEETLEQTTDDGIPLVEAVARAGIVAGIKVDKGTHPLPGTTGELITQGLDGLTERLAKYKAQGARFAKWREVYPVSAHQPTTLGIDANAEMLARYAATCQQEGLVPIVEPEVLLDGDHSMSRCAEVIEQVQHAVFHALHRHGVKLELMLLKPSMVLPGKESGHQAEPEEVARATLRVLRRTVPAAVPGIHFLSGGQTAEQATANLNAMNVMSPHPPWELSFSYARALQQPVLDAWRGRPENTATAQRIFLHRARLNAAARRGQYTIDMEKT